MTGTSVPKNQSQPTGMNACLRENKAKLSVSCRKVVEARGG